MACEFVSKWGPCHHHVSFQAVQEDGTFKKEEVHVVERFTYKPNGKQHTTYRNSKWVKQFPVEAEVTESVN